jgi:hypothetical protein
MPVKVVNLPPELGLTPEWMASAARDQMEQSISQLPGFIPVSRAILDAALGEHRLSQPLGFSQQIESETSRVIPAQLLLTTTMDGIHLGTSVQDDASAGGAGQQKLAPRTYSTWITIGLMWRVLEASTGATVAYGPAAATATASEKQLLLENTAPSLYAGLAGRVLKQVVAEQSEGLQRQLVSEPFRARIVKTHQDGVELDCGANAGLSVGDAFAVRRRPAPAAGLIRISEVRESTALGQVLEESGPLRPGDELEWVGFYTQDAR